MKGLARINFRLARRRRARWGKNYNSLNVPLESCLQSICESLKEFFWSNLERFGVGRGWQSGKKNSKAVTVLMHFLKPTKNNTFCIKCLNMVYVCSWELLNFKIPLLRMLHNFSLPEFLVIYGWRRKQKLMQYFNEICCKAVEGQTEMRGERGINEMLLCLNFKIQLTARIGCENRLGRNCGRSLKKSFSFTTSTLCRRAMFIVYARMKGCKYFWPPL